MYVLNIKRLTGMDIKDGYMPPVEGFLFTEEDFVSDNQTCERLDYDFADLFGRLSRSAFRSRFRLKPQDKKYVEEKGMAVIRQHAADFVRKRLAPSSIPNDGRQTPMRGHPVFIAQHATGCCCRGCFEKWHGIPRSRALTPDEQAYAVAVIMEWIRRQMSIRNI